MEFDSKPFVPWKFETILKHETILKEILLKSFLPASAEHALDDPQILHTLDSLNVVSGCKICQTLHLLSNTEQPELAFYADYACLCYYALHAPKSWTSNLMVLADFLEILNIHFSKPSIGDIRGIDIYLHFFINKCFKPIDSTNILQTEHLNFLKAEFLKASFTGTLSGVFCFKSIWPNKSSKCICEGKPVEPSKSYFMWTKCQEASYKFLNFILSIWKDSEFLSAQNRNLAEEPSSLEPRLHFDFEQQVATNEENMAAPFDVCQGPCLLGPSLNLAQKNNTTSLCILCECLACHSETKDVLDTIKQLILNSFGNGIKLIDRISFILQDTHSLLFIKDQTVLKRVIENCSPQEIHKHLFCDPLCALNSATVNQTILFGNPDTQSFRTFKASLATGLYLKRNGNFGCEILETLVIIFKSIQNFKLKQTIVLEIIKEIDTSLNKHSLDVSHIYQTYQTYT